MKQKSPGGSGGLSALKEDATESGDSWGSGSLAWIDGNMVLDVAQQSHSRERSGEEV